MAKSINRTPSSIQMKLHNFQSLDPEFVNMGKVGLRNASKMDRRIWEQYADDWDRLCARNYEIEKGPLDSDEFIEEGEMDIPYGGFYVISRKERKGQYLFRSMVLNAYDNRCCITGIDDPGLLIASHIKPWSVSDPAKEKLNPSNGVCLNALHDLAFDKGLITISTDYRVIVSKKLSDSLSDEAYEINFGTYDEKKISLPSRYKPDNDFLEYHNRKVFVDSL